MCGIVGVAGNLFLNDNKIFRDLLIFDQVRGFDSTGVIKVPCQVTHDVIFEKALGTPSNLWEWGSDLMDPRGHMKTVGKCYIGHNRAATVGKVSVDTAHPFSYDMVTGVHNGTLVNYKKTLRINRDFEVDSQYLYYHIAKKGLASAWNNMQGAAAIVYWDNEKNTLNMARNHQRPLYVAKYSNKKAIMWASEEWMLYGAAARHKVEIDKPEQISVNKHYIFDVTSVSVTLRSEQELKPFTPPKVISTHGVTGVGDNRPYKLLPANKKNKKKNSRIVEPSFNTNCNSGWAKGLEKADKELRGRLIQLKNKTLLNPSFVPAPDSNGRRFGKFETTDTHFPVIVYPLTSYDVREMRKIRFNDTFKLQARPRIIRNKNGSIKSYAISFSEIKPHIILQTKVENEKVIYLKPDEQGNLFLGPEKGRLYTEKEYEELMMDLEPSHSCSWCSSPLDPEDHDNIQWLDKTQAICPECQGENHLLWERYGIDLANHNYMH